MKHWEQQMALNRQALAICEGIKKLGNNEIDSPIGRFGIIRGELKDQDAPLTFKRQWI